uniref:Heat shock 70 kDa protein 12B n=1 Tax=Talaromyces marneffei PM1 TaxID=1077442 RepID=A0A093VIN4_TALMA
MELFAMGEIYPASSHAFIQATPDGVIADPEPVAIQRPGTRHFIVAVDFGTTFSSVSVYCQRDGIDIDTSQINSISNYPGAMSFMSQGLTEVPTQSWYPKQGRPIRQPVDTEINAGNGDDLDESTDVVEDETIVATHSESGDHGSNRQGIEEADLMDVEHDEDDVMDEDDKIRDHIYWGWEVSKFMTDNDIYGEQSRHIARSKLLLDHSSHTKHIRNQLASTVKDLRARKLIRDETDIIADFLSRLFRHTKSEMNRQHGYRNDCSVEFVLCIPVMWTEKACRIMQNAMTRALREAEFIEHSNYDVDNLFIVTEPEAASTYALERSREITAGDCFLLLDAGGGTVDAITYRVASRSPLRLEREEFDPEASHTELEEIEKGIAIEGKINELLLKFETQIKRGVDIYSSDLEPERLFVGGLTAKDNEKYIKPNRLIIKTTSGISSNPVWTAYPN